MFPRQTRFYRAGSPNCQAICDPGRDPHPASAGLVERHLGDLPPPDLEQAVPAPAKAELEVDAPSVHPDRPLRDQPPRRAGRGCEAQVLDQLADPDLVPFGADAHLLRLVRRTLLEALLEEACRCARRRWAMEPLDQLGRERLLG